MATAEQYAQWIVNNADKRGTPEFNTVAEAYKLSKEQYSETEKPEPVVRPSEAPPITGFTGALESSYEKLKGEGALLAGKVGLMKPEEAEAYQKGQEEKAKRFKPTEGGWTEAPVSKFKELLGGSLPYMAAPIVAGAAGAIAAPELAVAGLGAGALGAFGASATQFTGSNLARQMESGKNLQDTSLLAAGAAAVPQAALDALSFKMMPGIRQILGSAGIQLTEKSAKEIAERGILSTAGEYAAQGAKVSGIEGTTEAAQQFFERLQAGLNLTDEAARKEYYDNFIGGAILGGAIGGAGYAAEKAMAKAPEPPATPAPPQTVEAPQIDPDKYMAVIPQLQEAMGDAGISDTAKLADIFKAAGVDNEADVSAYLKAATDSGEIKSHVTPVFEVQDVSGKPLFRTTEESIANQSAERLNAETPGSASVVPSQITKLVNSTEIPYGTEIQKGQFKQEAVGFDILAGNNVLLTSPTVEEAQKKVQRLAEIRAKKAAETKAGIDKLQKGIDKNNSAIEEMEAEGQANTPEYVALTKKTEQDNSVIQEQINQLKEGQQLYAEPLLVKPSKPETVSSTGYTVFQDDKPVAHYATLKEAEEASKIKPTSVPTQEVIAAKESLRQTLLPFMKQVGLEGTGLRIMDSIESGQGSGDGYYAQNLIGIALESPNPMGTLRHETAHALKELGAFTDQDWKLLEATAKKDWINRFIKGRNAENGRSLYDSYKDIYQKQYGNLDKFDEYIAEEAIADAFKYFNANGIPVSPIGVIFRKIKAFFDALRNSFSGHGFQTADQVFKRIEMGKMRPTRAAPEGNAPRYEIVSLEGKRKDIFTDPDTLEAWRAIGRNNLTQPVAERFSTRSRDEAEREVYKKYLTKKDILEAARIQGDVKPNFTTEEGSAGNQYIQNLLNERSNDRYLDEIKELKKAGPTEMGRAQEAFGETIEDKRTDAEKARDTMAYNRERVEFLKKTPEELQDLAAQHADSEAYDVQAEAYQEAQAEGVTLSDAELEKIGDAAYKNAYEKELTRLQKRQEKLRSEREAPRFSLKGTDEIKARIDVDGVMRPTRNNKGTLLHPTKEGIQNFWRWFGDSVVVDEKGYPRLVLHGTSRDFETFTPKQAGAIFFTDDPFFANTFSNLSQNWMVDHVEQFLTPKQIEEAKAETLRVMDDLTRREYELTQDSPIKDFEKIYEWELAVKPRLPTSPNIMPIYVKMKNPFDYENKKHVELVADKLLGNKQRIKFKKDIEDIPPNKSFSRDDLIRLMYGDKNSSKPKLKQGGFWQLIENDQVINAIKSLGFDGISVFEDNNKNYAVFKENQIKSAVGNVGTFDEKNPNIRYSISSPDTPTFKRWFGNSKVVNGDGKPLVMYHGTSKDKDFPSFNIGQRGSWFTSSPEDASSYSTENDSQGYTYEGIKFVPKNTASRVIPVFLSIQNPYILTKQDTEDLSKGSSYQQAQRNVFSKAKAKEHDGIDMGSGVWVVLNSPTQIKSAIGNKGTFDDKKKDIRYSLRDDFDANFGQAGYAALNRATYVRQEKGAAQRMAEAISPDNITAIRQRLVNKYESVERLSKLVAQKFGSSELLADVSANAAALQADRAAGIAAEALMNGIPVYEKGYTKVTDMGGKVKGLIPILAPLLSKYKDPMILQMFQFYSATRRGIRLYKEGREQVLTPADFAMGKKMEVQYPEFKTAFDEYQIFNKGLVKFLVDTGVLSQEMAIQWTKYGDYIPFYRQVDGVDTVGPKMFQNLSGVKPTPELKGGDAQIGDYLETVVRNTRSAIEQGMKNVAAQRIVRDVMRLNTQGMNDMGRKLQPHEKGGPDVVTVRENGQDVRYKVADPLLVESMKSLHNLGINSFWKFLSYPTKLLRELVTKDPGFILANLARDSMQAWVTSGVSMVPIVDTMKQFGKVLANQSPEAKALRAAGIGTGYEFSGDIKASAKAVMEALNDRAGIKTNWQKAMWPVSKVWDALDKGSNASDLATRAEIYKKVMAETGNEAEAVSKSLEVMNFGRMGSSPMIQVISAIVPFFNARVQGMDVLYRAGFGRMASENAKAQQKAFMIRSATIVGLSLMYYMLARDTDEWKRASKETRDNYWIIGSVKIPIPFEIGVMFKVAPERIAAYIDGKDTGAEVFESATRNIISTLKLVPIPQAALPLVEEVTNYSFFTGEPIISRGMENVAAPFQERSNTSLMAKKLGEALGLSPIRIDHVLQGYTGAIGTYTAQMIDAIIRTEEDGVRPAMSMEQVPVLKRFLASDKAGGTIDAFYALKNQVDEVVRTQHELQSRGNPDQYVEYMEKNGQLLGLKGLVSNIDKQMTNLRRMRNMVNFSQGLDANDKREALDNIRYAEIALTENIKEIKKNATQ